MADNDHAILIGISRYPALGPQNAPMNLRGPDGDLDDVYSWLVDPNGGAVPKCNVQVVRCPSAGDNPTEPGQGTVERALVHLQDLAQANPEGYSVGRRLYIYMSGHGFSASPERACLFTADARSDWGRNVHATGWLSWLRDAGLFRQLVLWMDCCMDGVGYTPGEPDLRKMTSSAAAGPSFVAFAAPRPLRAVEREDSTGTWHGVFTSVLLEGLEGAAVDANGRVTGRSLGDWLRHALAGRLSPDDVSDTRIAKEPMIVRDDAELVFGRGIAPKTYPVTIRFPAFAASRDARLWYGSPPATICSFPVTAEGQHLALRPGLYAVDVPSAGLRHGFAVTGAADVEVANGGPPIVPAAMNAIFRLRVIPTDGGHEIGVSDARLASADAGTGALDVKLPFGLYKVRVSTGRSLREQVILLDRDLPNIDPALVGQPSAAVAPIPGTAAGSDFQARIANITRSAALADPGSGTAVITVLARTFGGPRSDGVSVPWQGGIRVVDDAGHTVSEITGEIWREGGNLCAAAYAKVTPGTYFLRYTVRGQRMEQALIAVGGWSLDATLLFRPPLEGSTGGEAPRVSLLMRCLADKAVDSASDERAEAARLALVDERDILSGPLSSTLLTNFPDPMTGFMVGNLLLLANARGTRDLAPMSDILARLGRMVGDGHPDLTALRVAAGSSAGNPVSAPPMFAVSWQPLIRAGLMPVDVWQRVQAGSTLAPYLVWAADDAVQASVRQDLVGALLRAAQALGLDQAALSSMAAVARGTASLASSPGVRAAVSSVVAHFSPALLASLAQSRADPILPVGDPGGDAAGKPEAAATAGLLGSLFQSYAPYVSTSTPNFDYLWVALEEKAEELGIPRTAISGLLERVGITR